MPKDYEAVITLRFGGTTSQTFASKNKATCWARRQEDGTVWVVNKLTYGAGGEVAFTVRAAAGWCGY
jgi:hypothetical protein